MGDNYYTVYIIVRKYIMTELKKYIHFIEMYRKAYPDLQKKVYRSGLELWLNVKKDQKQHENTIIELKGRAGKFCKSSRTFWAKAVSQPKNKQKFAGATKLMDITDLQITSILYCLSCFYYQAKFEIKFP